MHTIVNNLDTNDTSMCLEHLLCERIEEECGVLANPINAIICKEIADEIDDLATKAARAQRKAMSRDVTATQRNKYFGIVEGLAYAISGLAKCTYAQAMMLIAITELNAR